MIDVAIEAATTAGKFLRQNVGKIKSIEKKGGEDRNLVTEIDKGSEAIIISMIHRRFPGHDILAEESGATMGHASDYRWVIDPLDGTTNFTHGLPVFCVSIGLEHKGELIAGVVYDPNAEELFTAERGAGAFLNGKKIRVSSRETLKESLLVTGFPYNIAENPNNAVEHFVNFLMKAQAVRRMGSAAIDLAYVAAGRFDAFWEVALHPWDMAAGVLLVKEAGGMVSDFGGKEFNIYNPEMLSSNGKVHGEMVEILGKPH
jgi:myo-inositol-1(or 4)-monophosphatase